MDSASNTSLTLAGEDISPRDALQNLISTHRSFVEGRYWDPTTKEQAALLYAGGEYLKLCAADLHRQMGRLYAPQQRQDGKASRAAADPTLLNGEFRNRTLPSHSRSIGASESPCGVGDMCYSDLINDKSTVFHGSQLPVDDPSIGTWDDGVRVYQAAKAKRYELLACMRETSDTSTIHDFPTVATLPSARASVSDEAPASDGKNPSSPANDDAPTMSATYMPGDDKGGFGGFPAW